MLFRKLILSHVLGLHFIFGELSFNLRKFLYLLLGELHLSSHFCLLLLQLGQFLLDDLSFISLLCLH